METQYLHTHPVSGSGLIRHSTPSKTIALIAIDIILALFFAIACFGFQGLLETSFIIRTLIDAPIYLFEWLLGREDSIVPVLYAGTTFIPTFIYLTILATLILSKAILGIGIRITKYMIETATEVKESKDLAVFTLTGSLFSVIVLLLTTFTKLIETLYQ